MWLIFFVVVVSQGKSINWVYTNKKSDNIPILLNRNAKIFIQWFTGKFCILENMLVSKIWQIISLNMSLPSSLAEVSHNRSKCRPTNWNIIDFLHKKNICEKQLGYLWLIEESKASGLPAREMLPSACSQIGLRVRDWVKGSPDIKKW